MPLTWRTPIAAGLALALLAVSLPTSPTQAQVPDEAWLASTHERLDARIDGLVDVGVASEPVPHVAVLVDGEPPGDLDLHPHLDTRAYDVSAAQPLTEPAPVTHGPIVPVMLRTATDVPDEIRPGAWIVEPGPCTLAHILRDGVGDLYALTAGHCVSNEGVGGSVVMVTEAGPTGDTQVEIGETVAFRDDGPGQDYALVAIHDEHEDRVNPTMAGWQGPNGLVDGPEAGTVHHYGFGSAATWTHDATRCRAGASPGFWGATTYSFHGLVAFGDSGSPAQTASGDALGINTHISPFAFDGANLGTRADHAIAALSEETGKDLSLVTGDPQAPVCQLVG